MERKKLRINILNIINIILVLLMLLVGSLNNYKLLLLSIIFILTTYLLYCYVNSEKEYRDKLINLENKDELTGVCNYSFFQESFEREYNLCKELNLSICLLIIDIDDFKAYNHIHGYKEGNYILKEVANLLKENVRHKDIIGRDSGKKFVVILPNTSLKEAFIVGEKVRKKIEKHMFSGQDALPNKKITVSIGLSCFPDKSKNKQKLIKNAEDALYRAKYFNKNAVERYSSILDDLKDDMEEKHFDLISSIKTLLSVINSKDRLTYEHTERVVIYCDLLANKLNLSDNDKKTLLYGAYLHDIGKINIPKEILVKKNPFTDEEWNIIKKHCENGVEIIKNIDSLKVLIPLILHHHERYDGTGYPLGLRKENIPYLARILTVADSFDAMTSNRPYKRKISHDEAIKELQSCKYTQFDPEIVDAFIEII